MSCATPPDRTPAQRFAMELGRLRAMTRRHPVAPESLFAQAREVARCAHEAGHPLELLVEALAGVVPADAYAVRTLPAELVEVGVTAYLALTDRPRDVLLG